MVKNYIIKALDKYASKWVVLFIDITLICISFIITYFFRFSIYFNDHIPEMLSQIPYIIIVSFFSFLIAGSYKGVIRHTGTKDAFNVFYGVSIISFIVTLMVILHKIFNINELFNIPRSIILIHYLLSIFILLISRYAFKAFFERSLIWTGSR